MLSVQWMYVKYLTQEDGETGIVGVCDNGLATHLLIIDNCKKLILRERSIKKETGTEIIGIFGLRL